MSQAPNAGLPAGHTLQMKAGAILSSLSVQAVHEPRTTLSLLLSEAWISAATKWERSYLPPRVSERSQVTGVRVPLQCRNAFIHPCTVLSDKGRAARPPQRTPSPRARRETGRASPHHVLSPTELRVATLFKMAQAASGASAAARTPRAL